MFNNIQNENLNLLLCVAMTIEIQPLSLCGLNPVIMWSAAPLVCSIVTVSPLSGISNYHRSPGWPGSFPELPTNIRDDFTVLGEKNHNQRVAFRIYANQTALIL